jgi:predicted PurR-regulated permease PerM
MRRRADGSEPRPEAPGNCSRTGSIAAAILALAAVGLFLHLIRNLLLVFLIPLIIAYVMAPLIDWVARRGRLPRWTGALVVLATLTGLAVLACWIAVPAVLHEIAPVARDLRGTVEGLGHNLIGAAQIDILGRRLDASHVADTALAAAEAWLKGTQPLQFVAAGIATVLGAILGWVLLAYFLLDGPGIARGAFALVPPSRRALVVKVCTRLDPILRRYFVGVALVVLYASCAAYAGLGLVLGLRHAIPLAVLTGVLELLPVIGPAASAIIAGLIATHEAKNYWDILGYVIYAFALRISIDQFIGPLVLGRAASVSPVLVIFAFLVGGLMFGISGVILALPIALGARVTLQVLYEEP